VNKKELIKQVAQATNNPQTKVTQVVDQLFKTLSQTIAEGGKVSITDFGHFELKVRESRTMKAINGKVTKTVRRHYPKFKPAAGFTAAIDEQNPLGA
jgi:nucleoid DNA-binding protein